MAVFAILRHILSLYSNQKTTCAPVYRLSEKIEVPEITKDF